MPTLRQKKVCTAALCLILTAAPSLAQTFTSLHSFTAADGSNPYAPLIQSTSGKLFGTTSAGGSGGSSGGTVFKVSTTGALTTVYNFCSLASCADGTDPRSPVVQALNGNFYGTSFGGGPFSNPGTIFQLTSGGTLTTLYTFCALSGCTDGETPFGGLVQALNGTLYGATSGGGTHINGTVFSIKTSGGALTTLYDFCSLSGCADGESPQGTLIQGTDNSLYGTTFGGGTFTFYGSIFKITPAGVFTSLHSFDNSDGSEPVGGLVQAVDGNFYGATQTGGAFGFGTIYKITSLGTYTILYNFCMSSSCPDGSFPQDSLIQGTDGNLYGTTLFGGTFGLGTIFSISTGGTFTTLHSFDSADGSDPWAGLVQDTNGTFYGTTYSGGTSNLGTVYSLSVGLGPFIKAIPPAAKVGAQVHILGQNLSTTTAVTFNKVSAGFVINSSTEVTATVPIGATSGKIQVTTSSGKLSTYPKFRVTM